MNDTLLITSQQAYKSADLNMNRRAIIKLIDGQKRSHEQLIMNKKQYRQKNIIRNGNRVHNSHIDYGSHNISFTTLDIYTLDDYSYVLIDSKIN